MRATDLIRQQHEQVRTLALRIAQAPIEERGALVQQLGSLIRAHNQTEQELFYPRFADREGFEDLIADSYQEHEEATLALAEAERSDPDSPEFLERLQRAQDLVFEHAEKEERELLPRVEALWTNDMLDELGREFLGRFDQLLESVGGEARI